MRALLIILVLLALPACSKEDPSVSLLSQHGWTVEKELSSGQMSFSKKLTGNPELFYQRASRDIGLDLGVAEGKEVSLRFFLLTERGAKGGARIMATVALFEGRPVGAWLYTDAPVAPGIFSLKDKNFAKTL